MPFNKQGILCDATPLHHACLILIDIPSVNYAVFTDIELWCLKNIDKLRNRCISRCKKS